MNAGVTIVTPENIQVTYRTAGITSRFAAMLVDLTFQLLLVLLIVQVVNLCSDLVGAAGIGIGGIITGLGMVALFLIVFAYAILFEMLWGGRTPGKRLLGLRVIRDGGLPITFVSSTIRNVLRFLDFGIIPIAPPLVLFGLPGLLSIFFSPESKRIGDIAAGTIVIVETSGSPLECYSGDPVHGAWIETLLASIHHIERLKREEYLVLRRFAARR